ncbi:hypothetical protein KR215_002352 [Drosophila sulfurigaster]|nr:hypothetical protein KR215_002352 [Drosophila sulfurigaster]
MSIGKGVIFLVQALGINNRSRQFDLVKSKDLSVSVVNNKYNVKTQSLRYLTVKFSKCRSMLMKKSDFIIKDPNHQHVQGNITREMLSNHQVPIKGKLMQQQMTLRLL